MTITANEIISGVWKLANGQRSSVHVVKLTDASSMHQGSEQFTHIPERHSEQRHVQPNGLL